MITLIIFDVVKRAISVVTNKNEIQWLQDKKF